MGTTKDEIRAWLERGKADGAAFMIVATDTFDYGDYPVFVMKNTDVRAEVERLRKEPMTRVMEVYSYGKDLDLQLAEHRAYNLD